MSEDEPMVEIPVSRAQELRDAAAGHVHAWVLLAAQPAQPAWMPLGKPTPRTAVAGRCSSCGEPGSWLLTGEWTVSGGEIGPA